MGRRREVGRVGTREELVVVEVGERDGVGAGALAGAGGAALVGLDAGEAAGEAGAAGAPVLPRLLPALLARSALLAGGWAGAGGRLRLHAEAGGARRGCGAAAVGDFRVQLRGLAGEGGPLARR
jgi:hypothetical protein